VEGLSPPAHPGSLRRGARAPQAGPGPARGCSHGGRHPDQRRILRPALARQRHTPPLRRSGAARRGRLPIQCPALARPPPPRRRCDVDATATLPPGSGRGCGGARAFDARAVHELGPLVLGAHGRHRSHRRALPGARRPLPRQRHTGGRRAAARRGCAAHGCPGVLGLEVAVRTVRHRLCLAPAAASRPAGVQPGLLAGDADCDGSRRHQRQPRSARRPRRAEVRHLRNGKLLQLPPVGRGDRVGAGHRHRPDRRARPGAGVTAGEQGPGRSTLVFVSHRDAARNEAVYRKLLEEGVDIALRRGRLRLSPHFYNTAADVDRALSALRRSAG